MRARKKTSKREIPQSWYHMPGPTFLMRQRSMYSLALSHTGGAPIMPQVNLFKQTPHLIPAPLTERRGSIPARLGRPTIERVYLHSLTKSPGSFHRNPTLTESDSCHQTEKRNLAFALARLRLPSTPSATPPSPPPLSVPPLYTQERCRSQGRVCRLVFD